jgi:TolB-like protein/tetratricopeptide (TPR) repeat protein
LPATSKPSQAVFLSYASQDADAARRICDALLAAGIEVWFDQSELRGGDAWDQKIRRQIRDCALFVPLISRTTQARGEGYFRLEWRLADQRTHLMGRNRAFLLPVCVDDTPEAEADVPDSFTRVQWTRLPAGASDSAFADRVRRLLSPDAEAAPTPAPAGPVSRGAGSGRSRSLLLLLVVAVLLVIGYAALDRFVLSRRTTAPLNASAPIVAPEQSIAVLPFVDMSEKKDQEYFSDGLAEELIDQLTRIPHLHVIARTSSFSFKGKSEDIPTIASKLKVAHILEGSVRKSGDRLRVTTQLIRADSGEDLWAETYDRQLKDVFQVQDEIAGAVVSALKLKLSPGQQASSSHRTSNTEAYTQYLLGRQLIGRGETDDFRQAVVAFSKAIDLDPGYAAAYAELAVAQASVADRTVDAALFQQSLKTADRAVALAPDEAEGYAARGYLRRFNWDWAGAQTDLEKALSLDPGDSTVQFRYASLLATMGRRTEAIAALQKSTSLDPLSSVSWAILGGRLTTDRQYAAAHDALRRSLEIQPDLNYALYDLGMLEMLEGNAAQALSTFHRIDGGVYGLSGVAMAQHSLGRAGESDQAVDALIAKFPRGADYQIAQAYAWRGDRDKAFHWLDSAYQSHDGGMAQIKDDLALASLRNDGRFTEMLRKLQLPE